MPYLVKTRPSQCRHPHGRTERHSRLDPRTVDGCLLGKTPILTALILRNQKARVINVQTMKQGDNAAISSSDQISWPRCRAMAVIWLSAHAQLHVLSPSAPSDH